MRSARTCPSVVAEGFDAVCAFVERSCMPGATDDDFDDDYDEDDDEDSEREDDEDGEDDEDDDDEEEETWQVGDNSGRGVTVRP